MSVNARPRRQCINELPLLADHIRALGRHETEGILRQHRIGQELGKQQRGGLAEVVAHFHQTRQVARQTDAHAREAAVVALGLGVDDI